jgi:hypothetical protein
MKMNTDDREEYRPAPQVECGCCASYDSIGDTWWPHKHSPQCNHVTKKSVDYDELEQMTYYCTCCTACGFINSLCECEVKV